MKIYDLSMPIEEGHLRWPIERFKKGSFADGADITIGANVIMYSVLLPIVVIIVGTSLGLAVKYFNTSAQCGPAFW